MSAGKGQSERLQKQHELSGGQAGIFGGQAKRLDVAIRFVMSEVMESLEIDWPTLRFRHRKAIAKAEINEKLASIDPDMGQVLFVEKAEIQPDGGVIEVRDKRNKYRVVLVSESKHQGNDVEKIRSGIKQGKNKDQDLMAAGNAIERTHKNVQELRNFMLDESHFPYVIFFQGFNFATETFIVQTPDGRSVRIGHDDGSLNRIDRVTASSYGMKINRNYCRNAFIELDGKTQMLQAASLYFRADPWPPEAMAKILREVALTSIDVLLAELEDS